MECLQGGVVYNLACSVSAVCSGPPTNQIGVAFGDWESETEDNHWSRRCREGYMIMVSPMYKSERDALDALRAK